MFNGIAAFGKRQSLEHEIIFVTDRIDDYIHCTVSSFSIFWFILIEIGVIAEILQIISECKAVIIDIGLKEITAQVNQTFCYFRAWVAILGPVINY